MVGCNGSGGGGEPYTLAIASTFGGSLITPGEGTYTYGAGTMIDLIAEPDEGYYFSHWVLSDMVDILVEDIIADVYDPIPSILLLCDCSIAAVFFEFAHMVAAGWEHTVGLKSDGTVVATGRNYSGQCNVTGWVLN